MTDRFTPDRFVLHRIDDRTWLIQNHAFPPDDARRVIACIHETDEDEMEVVWVQPTPLPTRYAAPLDVLDDVVRWTAHQHRGVRPVTIPHLPPPRSVA